MSKIDLTRIGMVSTSAKRRAGNLQIGYEILNEPLTDREREDLKRLQEESQDLKGIKLPNGRLPVDEKERIIRHFTPKYAETHMDFLVEHTFKVFTLLREDGTNLAAITDYLTDYIIENYETQIGTLLSHCDSGGWVKLSLPKDLEEHIADMFKILLQQKFIIDRTDANGDLILKSLANQQQQTAFFNQLLEGTLQLNDAPK